ncbi:trichohyalin-like isoform X2 [Cotesia glomerata]|uniref:trichohyalin-like isoform X2 n=1 Tax=Cotesia glomerata TaxID=32391 RepID=UPI001D020C3F|nr:trichohyalin-like isoform X2 [Cotesia glomerata]
MQVPPRIHNNINLRNVTDRSDEELRNNEANLSMKELIEQNRKLNAIIEKQRYDSHNQHLQREREQQQIFEEEERQRQLMELHQRRKLLERAQREREELEREQQKQQQRERERREQEQRDQQQRNREQRERERRNQIDDEEDDLTDQVHIGGQIFISSLAYTEAFREYRPSKFITIMSHAIWGYENLALRAVKVGKRNARKLPLTPLKKLVLEKQYKKFLKQRNLSADMETVERNKINTYLGRSITSAIKKVANPE